MKIIQLLPTVLHGDAVSNDAFAIKKVIEKMGIDTEIYAEISGKNLPVKNISGLKNISRNDIIIYHMSTGTELNFRINKIPCRKIMIYHNITPPEFFRPYSRELFALTSYGYKGLEYLNNTFNLCIADSEYNKLQLTEYGYKCPVKVRPVLIPFQEYKKTPDISVMKKYSDGWTNIIFIGRIAPNKKHEDIIKTFYFYKKINPKSRLILVGSWTGTEIYYERLKKYVEILNLKDVIFTGHVDFSEIISYYRVADIFLCMSQHEGFCVPLVEAMFFNVPVVALNAGAVPETLGKSGIIIPENNPIRTAGIIHEITNNKNLRKNIINSQKKRLCDFSYKKTSGLLKKILKDFINGENI
ncbi:MAG: glycosyltransferase family 4 protein [Ruminococcus sp.]|nr:glycosyltransferase family 4 protein [Ruminococcus sp.]